MIPISSPCVSFKDLKFIRNIFKYKIFSDGYFQKKCEIVIKKKLKSKFIALTSSCTAALEISTILIDLTNGDEVIVPSYGFVSIANAITLRGAKTVFAEVDVKTLNISYEDIVRKTNKHTKAVYVIHYAGNSCEILKIKKFCKEKNIFLIEDAAHAFGAKYKNKILGTIGDIGVFSFHETKNIISGHGGCISINNKFFLKRVNYILDKGTDRSDLIKNFKKKIITNRSNKKFYSWVDLGSEYRLQELSCALLLSQLNKFHLIQKKRIFIWKNYLKELDFFSKKFYIIKPIKNSTSSLHLFIIVCKSSLFAKELIKYMQKNNVAATFHYVPLHMSKMAKKNRLAKKLPITENIFRRIVRLPLYPDLTIKEQKKIIKLLKKFFREKK